ncbi:hypothetical protein JOB18_028620 [Solea senegalensis]|uniref:Uncharacterized protein n=1 Tax=Solea senegalensis TaxID=28829 RepID=A0AAV6SGV9_SOLSE|nr:hypothetical protein JOB18_028620 [Solea senegalensis]
MLFGHFPSTSPVRYLDSENGALVKTTDDVHRVCLNYYLTQRRARIFSVALHNSCEFLEIHEYKLTASPLVK